MHVICRGLPPASGPVDFYPGEDGATVEEWPIISLEVNNRNLLNSIRSDCRKEHVWCVGVVGTVTDLPRDAS